MSATSGTIDPRSAADLGDWPERAAEAAARCAGLGIHPAIVVHARAVRALPGEILRPPFGSARRGRNRLGA